MLRREFSGGVVTTVLAAGINISANTFTVDDGSTFPDGSSGNPFVVSVGRGTSSEEKMLISSRSGNVFTVETRGYDGTTAKVQALNASVDHVLDSKVIQDMNTTTYDNQIMMWMEA